MLLQLAKRNLLRHRVRTATALGAIAFGVAALILSGGFVRDLYLQLGEALIHSQSGHLQIGQAALFAEGSRAPEKYLIADAHRVKEQVTQVSIGAQTMARLNFSGLLNNGKVDVPIVGEGIEPVPEAELAKSITILSGRTFAAGDRQGMMVGEGLARSLQLKPGDTATVITSTLDGAVNTGEFEVIAVFRSFSKDFDDRAVRIALPAAQELLATADANVIVVLLDDTARTTYVAEAVRRGLAGTGLVVKRWEEINDFYANTVALFDRQFAVLRLIILFMVLLGVANAVNMSVFERMGEFGTMRALGNRSRFVVALVMLECLLLGIVGAAVGVMGGTLLAGLISLIGIPMPPPPNSNAGYIARILLVPPLMAQAFVVGVVAAVLSGIVPALRARKISIVDALRTAV